MNAMNKINIHMTEEPRALQSNKCMKNPYIHMNETKTMMYIVSVCCHLVTVSSVARNCLKTWCQFVWLSQGL